MSGITNKDLEKLCYMFFKKDFLGVFPCDVLPTSKKCNISVIFNLSKHNEAGTHFIAIIKNQKKTIFFDSYGKSCNNESILKYLKQLNLPVEYNKSQIQADTSSLCGYFCFYFLYNCFLKNKSLPFLIQKFTKNKNHLLKNDTLLLKNISKILKIKIQL